MPSKRRGRPRTQAETRELIFRIAKQNLAWGCTRLQGALKNLGLKVSRATVANVLKESGHRSASVGHWIEIALRTGLKLTFDPTGEKVVGEHAQAGNAMLARGMRKPYEYDMAR